MSVTIDSLDIQIRSSAGSAAANIDKLAASLTRLRDSSKLTSVSNNLTKLSAALDKLGASSAGLGAIDKLATAMNTLGAIAKPTGLTSSLNALRKIPEITSSLNPEAIAAFSSRMTQLSTALTPLATQIERVGAGFAKLPASVTKSVTAVNRLSKAQNTATTAAKRHGDQINVTSVNLFAAMGNYMALVHTINLVTDAFSRMMAGAIEWDGIQFRFGRAFGEDAEEALTYVRRVSEELKINMQQFMQYSSMYGSLLKGFGMNQKQVTTISIGLTELSYDIWAAYNDRYKTLEDASEAVRSAITGEIEPIRNAGIALTEASMQEYLDSLGMAHIRMANLSEAQKSEVRYATMVNAAMNQGIVGTYAREMNTAEGAVRTLTQQLKGLGQAFGSLFLPILQKVVPWLSAFVELLTEAFAAIAALFGISFQEITWGAGSGMSDLAAGADEATNALGGAGKAAKKLRDYTMGFDELNVIKPPEQSGGGGGGGITGADGSLGLDLDTLWDESVFASASKQVDEIKTKIKTWFAEWKTEIALISGALGALSVAKLLGQMGKLLTFGNGFATAMGTVAKLASTAMVLTVQYMIQTELLEGFIDGEGFKNYLMALFVGAIGSGILYSMWGTGGLVLGLGVTAVASLSAVIDNGGITNAESAVTAITGLVTGIGALVGAYKLLKNTKLVNIIRALFATLAGNKAAPYALKMLAPGLVSLGSALSGAATAVGAFLAGISAPVWATIAGIIAAIASAAYFLYKNWDKVVEAAKNFFKQNIQPKLDKIAESWQKMKDAVSDLIPPEMVTLVRNLGIAIGNIVKKIAEWFKSVDWLEGIALFFEKLGGVIFTVVSVTIAGAFNTLVGIVENAVQIFGGFVQIIAGIIDAIVKLFSGDLDGARVAAKKILDGIVDLFKGLWGLTVGPIVDFVKGVIDWFKEMWDVLVGHSIVPDTIDAIVMWFNSLPGKILGALKQFVNNVIQTFKNMWESIKTWFNSRVAPFFTLTFWSNVFEAVRGAIGKKLEEFRSTVSEKWNAVKTWYQQNVAPKFTLAFWVDKFSGFKEGFVQVVRNMLNSGIDLINRFINWLNKTMSFDWPAMTIAGKTIVDAGSIKLFTIPLITQRFANGGFIEDGLFTMNQGEIAGKFSNGKSVVANNEQIIAGISEGVYRAVAAAMSESSGGEQAVNVYLDGKQIYASVKKTEAQRGRSIMGNQLGYAY